MISTSVFFASLTYTATIMVSRCNADQLPPPTDLEFKWCDNFTVMLSWKKPSGLSDIEYKYLLEKKTQNETQIECCSERNSTHRNITFLTENSTEYSVRTVIDCGNETNRSKPAEFQINPIKPKAVIVKDFNCLVHIKTLNCSWIPANKSEILTLYYRPCSGGNIEKCDQPYRNETTRGCIVSFTNKTIPQDICILIETEKSLRSFKPKLVAPPPEVTITEESGNLILNFSHSSLSKLHCWEFKVCYDKCGKHEGCQTTNGLPMINVPYTESCQYKFRSKATSLASCGESVNSLEKVLIYGVTNETVIVLTIVIPIVLSFFALLSCYCFRKHSAIFCPVIPDPSVMFKEIINGNKELKTKSGSLYQPVEEHIESCKILHVQDSCVFQQKS